MFSCELWEVVTCTCSTQADHNKTTSSGQWHIQYPRKYSGCKWVLELTSNWNPSTLARDWMNLEETVLASMHTLVPVRRKPQIVLISTTQILPPYPPTFGLTLMWDWGWSQWLWCRHWLHPNYTSQKFRLGTSTEQFDYRQSVDGCPCSSWRPTMRTAHPSHYHWRSSISLSQGVSLPEPTCQHQGHRPGSEGCH